MISRRSFLAFAGGAFVTSSAGVEKEMVPPSLDHVLLGCNDLRRGIDLVERNLGVRAAFGGVHPGRGTQNALLSFGERRYLEIIAPDPGQKGASIDDRIAKLSKPGLVGWAAHVDDIHELASRLRGAGVAFRGPGSGSRTRPDGRILSWKTLTLEHDFGSVLPFLIEWAADSLHPSVDAPKGCSLLVFEAVAPNPEELARVTELLGIELQIRKGERLQLRATLGGPKGQFKVSS